MPIYSYNYNRNNNNLKWTGRFSKKKKKSMTEWEKSYLNVQQQQKKIKNHQYNRTMKTDVCYSHNEIKPFWINGKGLREYIRRNKNLNWNKIVLRKEQLLYVCVYVVCCQGEWRRKK